MRRPRSTEGRRQFVLGIFGLAALALVCRGVFLQFTDKEFLQEHGDARYLRTVLTPAHRGMITDRNHELLAISTPVSSVWAVPRQLAEARDRWPSLASPLGMSLRRLESKLNLPEGVNREFVYLKRQVDPAVANRVMSLGIPGVSTQGEYRRYYPTSEVTAHLLGFTDVDDAGQEGVELVFDERLRGTHGEKRVLKDRRGHIVEDIGSISAARPGQVLTLSIDKRIQYLAYRELKAAVLANRARAGSIVILDARTGEVLAMANQPSYNPNDRNQLKGDHYRNRAVTDVFEPGSTMKPFTIAAALDAGVVQPATVIDTRPGFFKLGHHTVRDLHNYGLLDVAGIISKSSNIGACKIALSVESEVLWRMFSGVGFGTITDAGFPGEAAGHLSDHRRWREIDHATVAFGYGLSATTLQLAQAYTVFANDGRLLPVSLEPIAHAPVGRRVVAARTAQHVRAMLEAVVREGTGRLAGTPGYRVAGKTGTVRKTAPGGYAQDHYRSLFAGMIPASHPRLVAAIMIDEPNNGAYYGGEVAAPVFGKIMREAVRLLDVPPDDRPLNASRVTAFVAEAQATGAATGMRP